MVCGDTGRPAKGTRYRYGRDLLNGDGHVVHEGRLLHAVRKKTPFGRYGVAGDPAELAEDLWARYRLPQPELISIEGWEDDEENNRIS
jgi:hypothetical protein